jgi:hypothetical protein
MAIIQGQANGAELSGLVKHADHTLCIAIFEGEGGTAYIVCVNCDLRLIQVSEQAMTIYVNPAKPEHEDGKDLDILCFCNGCGFWTTETEEGLNHLRETSHEGSPTSPGQGVNLQLKAAESRCRRAA